MRGKLCGVSYEGARWEVVVWGVGSEWKDHPMPVEGAGGGFDEIPGV